MDGVFLFTTQAMRDILQNEVNYRIDLLPIGIFKLIRISDLVQKITDTRMSTDERNMQVNGNSLPGFRKICKKYSISTKTTLVQ